MGVPKGVRTALEVPSARTLKALQAPSCWVRSANPERQWPSSAASSQQRSSVTRSGCCSAAVSPATWSAGGQMVQLLIWQALQSLMRKLTHESTTRLHVGLTRRAQSTEMRYRRRSRTDALRHSSAGGYGLAAAASAVDQGSAPHATSSPWAVASVTTCLPQQNDKS